MTLWRLALHASLLLATWGALATQTQAVVPLLERNVEAYDCSVPSHLEPVQEATHDYCNQPAPQETKSIVHLRLLQKAAYTRVPVYHCKWISTIDTSFCGNYDHQTAVPQLTRHEEVREVSVEDCKRYFTDKQWVNPRMASQVEALDINSVNHFMWEVVGSTIATKNHVDCIGGKLVIPGVATYMDMVQTEHVKLTLHVTKGAIHAKEDVITVNAMVLQGRAQDEESRSSTGTYYWEAPAANACALYNILQSTNHGVVTGEMVTTAEGDKWFTSFNDTHIRLRIKDPRRECDQLIYGTNYKLIFATHDLSSADFSRPLHTSEQSISTFVNQQDAYVHDMLKTEMRRTLHQAMNHTCRIDAARRTTDYARIAAEKSASLDGETVGLDDGWFITRSGDGWHRYRCRQVTVQAQERELCFSGLPVVLNERDLNKYEHEHYRGPVPKALLPNETYEVKWANTTKGALEFFVTPVNHRLSLAGAPRPCVTNFPGLYQNANGRWLTVSPRLELLKEMRSVQHDMDPLPSHLGATPDFNAEGGGLYSAEDMRLQEEMQQVPRYQEDLGQKMTRSIMHSGAYLANAGDDAGVFSQMPAFGSWYLATFWLVLDRLANIMAILLGLLALLKVVSWAMGLVLRCIAVREVLGCGLGMLAACFPAWFTVGRAREVMGNWWARHRYFDPRGQKGGVRHALLDRDVVDEDVEMGRRQARNHKANGFVAANTGFEYSPQCEKKKTYTTTRGMAMHDDGWADAEAEWPGASAPAKPARRPRSLSEGSDARSRHKRRVRAARYPSLPRNSSSDRP